MQTRYKQLLGLPQKRPVKAATTTALAAGTYSNGTSGVGATFTETANGALAAIDGVTLVAGDRLLVKDQASALQNGIYTLTQVGSAGTPFILTRATDCDDANDVFGGITVVTTADGSTNPSRQFIMTATTSPFVMGTTGMTWALETETSANKPTTSNKNMAASLTTADFQAATATTLVSAPLGGGYIQVFVNGTKQQLGDAVKTKDCYFSSDGGTTAKAFSAIAAGDTLYWVGSVAGFQLETSDYIDFDEFV